LREKSFGKHGCPYCTSDSIGPNPTAFRDGLKCECKKCGRKFSQPIKVGAKR